MPQSDFIKPKSNSAAKATERCPPSSSRLANTWACVTCHGICPSAPAPTILTTKVPASCSIESSATPRVCEFVLAQRPISAAAFGVPIAAPSNPAFRSLRFLNSIDAVMVFLTKSVLPMRQTEIFPQEIIHSPALVSESMKFSQHQQSLHDHSLKFYQLKIKPELAGETSRHPRCRAKSDNVNDRSSPVDQTFGTHPKRSQRKHSFRFGQSHTRHRGGVGIGLNPFCR